MPRRVRFTPSAPPASPLGMWSTLASDRVSLYFDAQTDKFRVSHADGSTEDLVPEGGNGDPGLSAYEVAVAEGFVGTVSEWLESLVGEQGDQGIQGIQGVQGNPGADGEDGAPGTTLHSGLSDVTADQHHTENHASRHSTGQADAITPANIGAATSGHTHAAATVSIVDTANDFTATDVEGALAELQSDNEARHPSAGEKSALVGTGGTPGSGNKYITEQDADFVDLTDGGETALHSHPVSGAEGVPIGGIIMWSGTLASIPADWALCNGANGTPDLRDRFVVGAANGADPGGTGGTATHQHAAHTDVMNHTHGVTDPGHVHAQRRFPTATGGSTGFTVDTSMSGTEANANNTGSATTGVTTQNPAGGVSSITHDSLDNRPPYYAIAFIMRVS